MISKVRLKESARISEQQKRQIAMLDSNLRSMSVELKNSERAREENMLIAVVEKEKARKDDYVQLEMLERRIKLKCKELCQVKQAARLVLQQRSDIETFFLDALAFVRKQVNGDKVRRKVGERLPPITGNNMMSMVERGSFSHNEQSCTVDVSELAWEQKEQVLRMLFAVMGGSLSPTFLRTLSPLTCFRTKASASKKKVSMSDLCCKTSLAACLT